jgi:hypothetical protein
MGPVAVWLALPASRPELRTGGEQAGHGSWPGRRKAGAAAPEAVEVIARAWAGGSLALAAFAIAFWPAGRAVSRDRASLARSIPRSGTSPWHRSAGARQSAERKGWRYGD